MYWPDGVRHRGGVTPVCGSRGERGKAGEDMVPGDRNDRECSKRRIREGSSTVAEPAGGPSRSSAETPVIGGGAKGTAHLWKVPASNRPVGAVDIAKPHGGGVRRLGVPTVADRVAQTVVAMELEKAVEPKFHPSSYGYRPGRSPLDAVEACRRRCFTHPWVVDLDIEKFFDSVPWDLIVKAVEANTDQKWVRLYVQRWLAAPVQLPDGTLA